MTLKKFRNYKFSVSWNRIIPHGSEVNQAGIAHYHEVVNDMLSHGIEPIVIYVDMSYIYIEYIGPFSLDYQFLLITINSSFVLSLPQITLFHFDLPQYVQDLGGVRKGV